MLKLSIVIVTLLGVGLAHKHHGFVSYVRHIPSKIPEAAEGVQENEQQEAVEEVQQTNQGEGQDTENLAEGGHGGCDPGTDIANSEITGGEQTEPQVQTQGEQDENQEREFGDHDFIHPKYKFEYGVRDFNTGDHKSQWEIREGDFVKGEYTVADADGTHRIVKYKADDKRGFRASVRQLGKPFTELGSKVNKQNDINGGLGYSYIKLKRHF